MYVTHLCCWCCGQYLGPLVPFSPNQQQRLSRNRGGELEEEWKPGGRVVEVETSGNCCSDVCCFVIYNKVLSDTSSLNST